MFFNALSILAAILIFTILVVIHEFGHFIVAKLSGIRVEEFSVGMGPQIIGIKKGETLYSLRAFPLGGFCKMTGEDEAVEDERAFNKKPIYKRFLVIIAGSFMNILLTIVILSIGVSQSTVIDSVEKNMPAQLSGIQANDKIVSINGAKIENWASMKNTIIENADKEIEIGFIRDKENMSVNVTPKLDKEKNAVLIGIVPKLKIVGFSIVDGIGNTFRSAAEMISYLGDLIFGKASTDDIMGPVGITVYLVDAAKSGIYNLSLLAALLSLNLGVFNLLPLPALDGGRGMFLLIELIRGKAVTPEREGLIHFIGFALLMLLSVFVFYKDLVRLNIWG